MTTTEEKLMDEILQVYIDLSPENISWDGERPQADVIREERFLMRKLKDLFKQIGREVSDIEAYDWAWAKRK